MFETCQNPLCKAPLGPRLRKQKRFCGPKCRMDTWVLARAAQLLVHLEPSDLRKLFYTLFHSKKVKMEEHLQR